MQDERENIWWSSEKAGVSDCQVLTLLTSTLLRDTEADRVQRAQRAGLKLSETTPCPGMHCGLPMLPIPRTPYLLTIGSSSERDDPSTHKNLRIFYFLLDPRVLFNINHGDICSKAKWRTLVSTMPYHCTALSGNARRTWFFAAYTCYTALAPRCIS